ncbi:MAG: DUF4352 domain-containing protein [Dermatophilaceae bacterium]
MPVMPGDDATQGPQRPATLTAPTSPPPIVTVWWFWAAIAALIVLAGLVPAAWYLQHHVYPLAQASSVGVLPTDTPRTVKRRLAPAGGVGDRVRDGQVDFTVTGVDCTRTELGQYDKVTARGHFCVVSVQATNRGATDVWLSDDMLALTGDGTWIGSDLAAQMSLGGALSATPITPSSTVSGPLVFDVPDRVVLAEVLLQTGGRLPTERRSTGVVVRLE